MSAQTHPSPDPVTGVRADLPWHRQVSRQQWKQFVAAWIGYFLDGFDFVIISLVLTEVAKDFGLGPVQAATLVSAAFISRWFGGLAIGSIGDRFGRKAAMILSILLFSLGSLVCAIAPAYWVLFLARLFIGMGMAGEYSASSTYVIESWPVQLRNRASGFLISGYSIGTVLSAQVYARVVPNFGWRWMFAIGLVPIAIALYLRRALPESHDWVEAKAAHAAQTGKATQSAMDPAVSPPARNAPAMASAQDAPRDVLSVLFRGPRSAVNYVLAAAAFASLVVIFGVSGTPGIVIAVLGVVITAVFVAFMVQFTGRRWPVGAALMATVFSAFLYSWPIQSLLPTYLKSELHYAATDVSNTLTWAGLGAAVGCVVAGFSGDRFGTRRAYWCSLLVSQLLIFPVFVVGGGNLLLLGVLLFLQQVFGQGISGLLPKWIGGYFSPMQRAAGLGFTYNVGALGGAVAPVLGQSLAPAMSLGTALAVLSFSLTLVVMILIGTNAPARMLKAIHPDATRESDFAT